MTPERIPSPTAVREAVLADLPEITSLFAAAIRQMEADGIHQWDDRYPDAETLAQDIRDRTLYAVMQNGRIAAVFVLNRHSEPEYSTGDWYGDPDSSAVVHCLCVHPSFRHQGMGTQVMTAAESILRNSGCTSVRLDAFSGNPAALCLYERLGYRKAGTVRFRKGLFHLYEKML